MESKMSLCGGGVGLIALLQQRYCRARGLSSCNKVMIIASRCAVWDGGDLQVGRGAVPALRPWVVALHKGIYGEDEGVTMRYWLRWRW